jgi:hypothetical protein
MCTHTHTYTHITCTQVSKHLKTAFVESDLAGRNAVGALKRNIQRVSAQSVVHYSPQFLGVSKQLDEESTQTQNQHADKSAEHVLLGGLEEFGLEVFERLWRAIRQRFPS